MVTDDARSQSPDEQTRPESMPAFGVLLRRYRLASGLSQEQLAAQAGLSARCISDLERGARLLPRRDTLLRLASVLKLSPAGWSAFEASGMAGTFSLAPSAFHPCNLSTPPTRLSGRKAEVADVLARLKGSDARLLTLTGAGGVGKTRLAQEVGLKLLRRYAGRVWQVELASLRDTALVAVAVAEALGLDDVGGASSRGKSGESSARNACVAVARQLRASTCGARNWWARFMRRVPTYAFW